MSVLILYATIEGQTGKISRFLAEKLEAKGIDVTLVDAGDRGAVVSYDGVRKVILAASVHERKHPKAFEVLLSADKDTLAEQDTMMISVSLKAAFDETRSEAQDFLDEMKMRTGLDPNKELLVAGAIHPSYYDYYASQILRHVILRTKSIDPNSEHEFTDWDALEKEVIAFATT